MKKFLIHSGFFFLLLVVANIAGYFLLSKQTIYKDYLVSDRKLEASKVLLLGDSHSNAIKQVDLTPLGIKNFSFDGDSYFDILAKLEYVLSLQTPDTVFLCVDDHTLSKYREYWMNNGRSIYYAPYRVYKDFYHHSWPRFVYEKYGQRYFPFFNTKNSKIFGAYIGSKFKPAKQHHWRSFGELDAQDRVQRAESRIKTQFPHNVRSKKLASCLDDIIAACNENQVALIGIKFPLTDEYIAAQGELSYYADTVLRAQGIPVWDFKYCLTGRDTLFRDQDHVNWKGSKVFADILKEKIGAPAATELRCAELIKP